MKPMFPKRFKQADMVAWDLLYACRMIFRLRDRVRHSVSEDKLLSDEVWEAYFWLDIAIKRAELRRIYNDDVMELRLDNEEID